MMVRRLAREETHRGQELPVPAASYRLSHPRHQALLAALSRAALAAGLVTGADFDLDFHAIMHWGGDVARERHYVPRRSQRTRSGLSFFAKDAGTHTPV